MMAMSPAVELVMLLKQFINDKTLDSQLTELKKASDGLENRVRIVNTIEKAEKVLASMETKKVAFETETAAKNKAIDERIAASKLLCADMERSLMDKTSDAAQKLSDLNLLKREHDAKTSEYKKAVAEREAEYEARQERLNAYETRLRADEAILMTKLAALKQLV